MSSHAASRSNLTIVYQDIAALNPRKSNPRTHSKKQIDQLARAITQLDSLTRFWSMMPTALLPAMARRSSQARRPEPGSDGAPIGDERS